jgi:putative ATP-dependent endonuclease of OLD family
LEVAVKIMPPPDRFAYTQKLSLIPAGHNSSPQAAERVIFSINTTSARELAEKSRDARRLASISEDITKVTRVMDEDDFQGIRRGPDEGLQQTRYSYFMRRTLGDSPKESSPVIEPLIRQSTSYADFLSNAKSASAKFNDQLATVQSSPLKTPVDTFSGQETSVPQYVQNLIEAVGAIPVLYLTEHRKAVGREEAERLLQLKVERGGDEVLSNIKRLRY